LADGDLAAIDLAFPPDAIRGARYSAATMALTGR